MCTVLKTCLNESDWRNVSHYLGSIYDQIATGIDGTLIIENIKVIRPKLIIKRFDQKLSLDFALFLFEFEFTESFIEIITYLLRVENIICSTEHLIDKIHKVSQKKGDGYDCQDHATE